MPAKLKVLLLDLGETLVHGDVPFPHAVEALDAISGFVTADGEPLELALVSDFTMPAPPVTDAKANAIFQEYVALLDGFGLRRFFEPVEKRVTLSTHAGVFKPNRQIFELAIARLGLAVTFEQCLFITENTAHLAAATALGLGTLRFGPGGFEDWSEAPLLIAAKLSTENPANLHAALRVRLAATHGLDLISMKPKAKKQYVSVRVRQRHPISLGGETVDISLPAEAEIQLAKDGRIKKITAGGTEPGAVAEAESFARTLDANRQIARGGESMPPGTTHRLEQDASGKKQLVRKRFSAI